MKNSASHFEHVQQAKDIAQKLKATLGQDLNHEGYEKLFKETAINHDSRERVQPTRADRKWCENDVN